MGEPNPRSGLSAAVAVLGVVAVAISVATAPAPAPMWPCWRSASVLLAVALGVWNLISARRAFDRAGYLSAVGMLQVWVFFAFSMAAAEQCFRYDRLRLGYWRSSLDDVGTFGSVVLLGAFEVLFFLALGRDVPRNEFVPALRGGRASIRSLPRPTASQRRAVLLLVLFAAPFLAARVVVFVKLGVQTAAVTVVTRTDYFEYLGGNGVNPVLWLFSALFPVFGVSALCLAVRYAVPAVSTRGACWYSAVLVVCVVGCSLSGGRGDLVFVIVTVLLAMRMQGYRSVRQFAPVAVPLALSGGLLILVSQARNGHKNALTSVAGSPYVGNSYSPGDITQLLGLGRFDAVRMVVDKHPAARGLGAQDYVEAVKGALDSTFLPQIALGHRLGSWTVSRDVLGPWVFGHAEGSSLPSAPGELYLTFGIAGVLLGAVAFGVGARGLLRLAAHAPGPAPVTWVLVMWIIARALSDESHLIAIFVARNWLVIPLLGLLLRRLPVDDPPVIEDRPVAAGHPSAMTHRGRRPSRHQASSGAHDSLNGQPSVPGGNIRVS